MMVAALRRAANVQRASILRHRVVSGAVAILGITLLVYGWQEHQVLRVTGYLLAMWTAAFAVDVYCGWTRHPFEPFVVHRPGLELTLIAVLTLLAFAAIAMKNGLFTDVDRTKGTALNYIRRSPEKRRWGGPLKATSTLFLATCVPIRTPCRRKMHGFARKCAVTRGG